MPDSDSRSLTFRTKDIKTQFNPDYLKKPEGKKLLADSLRLAISKSDLTLFNTLIAHTEKLDKEQPKLKLLDTILNDYDPGGSTLLSLSYIHYITVRKTFKRVLDDILQTLPMKMLSAPQIPKGLNDLITKWVQQRNQGAPEEMLFDLFYEGLEKESIDKEGLLEWIQEKNCLIRSSNH